MTLARFKTIMDSYGGEIKRWPQEEQKAALALLQTSEEARTLCKEAAVLDGLLDLAQPLRATAELKLEIMNSVLSSPWERLAQELWPFGPLWRPAVAMVFSAILGLAAGGIYPAAPPQHSAETVDSAWNDYKEAEMLAFGPDYVLKPTQ
jgi:hypothetical protein